MAGFLGALRFPPLTLLQKFRSTVSQPHCPFLVSRLSASICCPWGFLVLDEHNPSLVVDGNSRKQPLDSEMEQSAFEQPRFGGGGGSGERG